MSVGINQVYHIKKACLPDFVVVVVVFVCLVVVFDYQAADVIRHDWIYCG